MPRTTTGEPPRDVSPVEQEQAVDSRINLEQDIFAEFDNEYRESATIANVQATEEATDAETKATRYRQIGGALEGVSATPEQAIAGATVLMEWLQPGLKRKKEAVPEEITSSLQTLEQLHGAYHAREQALPPGELGQDARERLRSTFFGNERVRQLSEQVITGLKDVGRRIYKDAANEEQGLADAAFRRSEAAQSVVADYPELGEVYETGKDTIPNARAIFRRSLLPQKPMAYDQFIVRGAYHLDGQKRDVRGSLFEIEETLRHVDGILEGTITKDTPYDRRFVEYAGHDYKESKWRYWWGQQTWPGYTLDSGANVAIVSELKNVKSKLERAHENGKHSIQSEYLIGERTFERIRDRVSPLPEKQQRLVYERQGGFRIKDDGAFYDGTVVCFVTRPASGSVEFEGIDQETQRILLQETYRSQVLRKIREGVAQAQNFGEPSINNPVVWLQRYAAFLSVEPDFGSDTYGPIVRTKDRLGEIRNLRPAQLLNLIQEKDPTFAADVAAIVDTVSTFDPKYKDMFSYRTADGAPYLADARETGAEQYRSNMRLLEKLTLEDMNEELAGNEKQVIFSAEGGVRAIETLQAKTIRALSEKDAAVRAKEQRIAELERELHQMGERQAAAADALRRQLDAAEQEGGRARERAHERSRELDDAKRKMDQITGQVGAREQDLSTQINHMAERLRDLEQSNRSTSTELGSMRNVLVGLKETLEKAKQNPGFTGGNAKQAVAEALDVVDGMLAKKKK